MPFKRITRLAASAGVAAGLAFGGLATVGATPANAATSATVNATYSCTNPLTRVPVLGDLVGQFDVPATITLQNLPDVLTNNVPIPAGTPIIGTLDLSQLSQGGLAGLLSTVGVTVEDLLAPTPLDPVGIQVNSLVQTLANNVATFQGTLTGGFLPTDALPLPIPSELGLDVGLLSPLLKALQIDCQLNRSAPIVVTNSNGTTSTLAVAKLGSKIKAKPVKRTVKKGQKAVVKVTVKTTSGAKGLGTLVAKVKGQKAKTVELKNGKAKLKLKKLKAGLNKVKLRYLGNSYTEASKKKLKIKVVR